MKARFELENVNLGFQLAPIIDVIFVIMLFYMVRAGQLKVEHRLNMTLPGSAIGLTSDPTPPDDVIISIDDQGSVTLNEEEIAAASDVKMDSLAVLLTKLRENADAHGGKVLATLQTDPAVPYQRVIEVMNALSRAKIVNMTFTVGEGEGQALPP